MYHISGQMFNIRLIDGRERCCHSNQMRYSWANTEEPIQEKTDVDCNDYLLGSSNTPIVNEEPEVHQLSAVVANRSYPSRNRLPPSRYTPSWSNK